MGLSDDLPHDACICFMFFHTVVCWTGSLQGPLVVVPLVGLPFCMVWTGYTKVAARWWCIRKHRGSSPARREGRGAGRQKACCRGGRWACRLFEDQASWQPSPVDRPLLSPCTHPPTHPPTSEKIFGSETECTEGLLIKRDGQEKERCTVQIKRPPAPNRREKEQVVFLKTSGRGVCIHVALSCLLEYPTNLCKAHVGR